VPNECGVEILFAIGHEILLLQSFLPYASSLTLLSPKLRLEHCGPRRNTVHFSTLIAFRMSTDGSRLSVRRLRGKLLILRLTARRLRRWPRGSRRSCRISSSTVS